MSGDGYDRGRVAMRNLTRFMEQRTSDLEAEVAALRKQVAAFAPLRASEIPPPPPPPLTLGIGKVARPPRGQYVGREDPMATRYVALIQQGMVLNQRVVAIDGSEQQAQAAAEAEAKRLNDAETGFGEGWTAVVLPVKS